MTELKQKQRLFAEEFAKSGNQREAYYKAGYKAKSDKLADQAASRLARNVKVKSYIEELTAKATDETVVDVHEALQILSKIARGEETEMQAVSNAKTIEIVELPVSKTTIVRAISEIMKRHPVTTSMDVTIRNPYEGLTEEELRKLAARSG